MLCYVNFTVVKTKIWNNEVMMIGHKALNEEQIICLFLVCHNFNEFWAIINQYMKNYPLKAPSKAFMYLSSPILSS